MELTKKYLDDLTYKVIGCAIEVQKHLGPGLLESVYEKCFARELELKGLGHKRQLWAPLEYNGMRLQAELRLDFMVEDILCVELKAIEDLCSIHHVTLLTYMRLLQKPKGVLINFNCSNIFKEGQKTLVNDLYAGLSKE